MSLLRPLRAHDLFTYNNVNLDTWTETYQLRFYLSYLVQWPDLQFIQTAPVSCLLEEPNGAEQSSSSSASTAQGGNGGLRSVPSSFFGGLGLGSSSSPGAPRPTESQSYIPRMSSAATAADAAEPSSASAAKVLPEQHPRVMGYVIGKAEGKARDLHGHVTAITVAPEFRRLGLAQGLMRLLEDVSSQVYDAFFVDLFVRPSNLLAVKMYEGLGYSVYRKVVEYYHGGGANGEDEDGYDMRKSMARDTKRQSVRANGRNYSVSPQSVYFEPVLRSNIT
ncbi:N-alpha-acetyltransferase 20 [Tilletia horrida]|uniref:N-alpha-acetyltransferase 20 n=1 Tax=Tilletia horrida TaxID=155126 RepID=A0AAN6JMQ2_9BASI|nr:N-alpha-acetyltransferase 20 [Tilletia horrida]KAK0538492.1 N-alpha-acetyltransferase 20 [Tilletia horrida]KAK0562237.1 N-alpha-acetyltransferase 20 [Tilletia horrida]